MFYCVIAVCTVGYVCSFHGDQIFVDFISFLSMIIMKFYMHDVLRLCFIYMILITRLVYFVTLLYTKIGTLLLEV